MNYPDQTLPGDLTDPVPAEPVVSIVDAPDPYPFEVSEWGQRMYESLLPLAYDDERYQWALLRLCESIGLMYEDLHLLISEDDEGRPGWSAMLDVDRCPPSQLGFLGQLVGVPLAQGWNEQQARDLIRAHPNWWTGTRQSFVGAAQQLLSGSQTVGIVERYEGDPDQVLIYTRESEVPETDRPLSNLLRDPSFENADFSAHWTTFRAAGAGTAAGTTEMARTGSRSAKLTAGPDGDEWLGVQTVGDPSVIAPVTAGEPYSVAAYSRSTGAIRDAYVIVGFYGSSGWISSVQGHGAPNTTDWQRTPVVSAVAPPGATGAHVLAAVWGPLANEVHYLDDLMLVEGEFNDDTMPDYGHGGQAGWTWSGTPNDSASVRTPTDKVLRALERVKPVGIKLVYETVPGLIVEEKTGTVDSQSGTIN